MSSGVPIYQIPRADRRELSLTCHAAFGHCLPRRRDREPDEDGTPNGAGSRARPRMVLAEVSEPVGPMVAPPSKTSIPPLLSDIDLLEEMLGHDDALDLVGSFVDLGDLGVAHEPLHREVLREPVAAEQLDSVDCDAHRRV